MAKVRFELNIDEIIESDIYINNDHAVFKNPEATGKTFLFVDKLTGVMQAALCKAAAGAENMYAKVDFFPLPQYAEIITEEETADNKHEALMAHIQDCCDVIRKGLVDFQNEVSVYIGQEFDALKSEGISNGNGISEKTLLEALKVVSK